MEAKAFQCMQKGLDVLFLIPSSPYNQATTHLTLKLQQKWQNLKEKHQWQNEVHIFPIKRKRFGIDYEKMRNLIESTKFKDAAIFADELIIWNENELQMLIDMVKVCQGRITWLAITYIKNSTENQIKPNFILLDFNKKYTMP